MFTINTDGTGETGLVSGWRQMKAPTWSADGTSLVFSFQSGGRLDDEHRSIDLAELAREGDSPRIPSEARDVEWEDGQLKYRLPMDANWYLKQFNLQTSDLEDVPAGQYSYSPFGHPTQPNLLLYTVGGRGIAMYDDANQTTWPVTTDPNDRAPALSPDGTKVAVSYNQGGHWEIHTFNLDGSNRQRLTQTPLSVLAERTALRTEEVAGQERTVTPEQPHWNNAAPAWSPDGSQIAFMTDRTGQWEIWIMNADGSNQRPMFPNGELAQLSFEYAGVDEHMLSWR
jgi:Tol biopolymer transport system component